MTSILSLKTVKNRPLVGKKTTSIPVGEKISPAMPCQIATSDKIYYVNLEGDNRGNLLIYDEISRFITSVSHSPLIKSMKKSPTNSLKSRHHFPLDRVKQA